MVVTIVVLLILAGVSISLILDENGIIKKSKEAREKYQEAARKEQEFFDNVENYFSDSTIEVKKFSQQNEKVTSFLNDADNTYTDDNFVNFSIVQNHAKRSEIYDDPLGYTIAVEKEGTIHIEDETNGSVNISENVSVGNYTIYDLIPNNIYKWYIESDGKITQKGRIMPTGKIRMIYDPVTKTDESDNIRDIGGWDCDGGTVKYSIIYRGENPEMLASATKEKLQNIWNVTNEIDLHADNGTQRLFDSIEYSPYQLSNSSCVQNLTLESDYSTKLANALVKVMENTVNGKVTYIHCWAGADRTGTICWMLEGLLGVSSKDCSIDYELTSFSGREARLRTDEFKSAMYYVTSIGHVNDMKDGILRWCEKSGISIDLINNFRKAMSTGVPEDLTYNNSDTNANIITKATTSDLKTIFNGTGYEDGKYCSTNDINTYSPDSNFFATGIMYFDTPISLANKTGGGTIYIKGAEFTEESHCRLQLAWRGTTIYNAGQMSTLSGIERYFTVTKISDKYYSLTPKVTELASALSNSLVITGFRISLPGSGANVIISYNEIN